MVKCLKCGKSVSENIKFCPDCGGKIIIKKNDGSIRKQVPKWFYYVFLSLGIIFLALEIMDTASRTCINQECYSRFEVIKILFSLLLAISGLLSTIFLLAKKYVSTSLLLPILSMVQLIILLYGGFGQTVIIWIYSILTICISLFFIWKD